MCGEGEDLGGGAVPPSCVASLGRSRGRAAEESVPCICWKKSRGLRADDGWMGGWARMSEGGEEKFVECEG